MSERERERDGGETDRGFGAQGLRQRMLGFRVQGVRGAGSSAHRAIQWESLIQ